MADRFSSWPELSYSRDAETYETLHLWTQLVGKVRVALTPWLNHSWHVALYVTARGLSTSLIAHPAAAFDLEFDFVDSALKLRTSAGEVRQVPLEACPVATFYARILAMLADAGVPVTIHGSPNEVAESIPFARDTAPRRYDSDAARTLWRAFLASDVVFRRFRTGFVGKASPVHFFWGSFDLAVTRFSGRPAPMHPGGIPHLPDPIVREAYSHEVSSAGFWPGGPEKPFALYYSYAYPEPDGFRNARGLPAGSGYDTDLREYMLPYDNVRTSRDPEDTLLSFLQATYDAAARSGGWDRSALECPLGKPRVVRPLGSAAFVD